MNRTSRIVLQYYESNESKSKIDCSVCVNRYIDSIMDNCITVRLVRLIISVISLAARLALWVTIRIPRTHQVVPYTQINIILVQKRT